MKFHGKNSNAFNFIDNKYAFRFNVVTNYYEFRVKGKKKKKKKKKWKKYDDRQRKTILLELMSEGIEVASEKVDIFIESFDFSPDYNPFEEYFENLPKWDKKTNHIKKIAKTVKTDKPKHFNKTFQRFLVGCIDCLLNPDSVNDVCLVFQSGQGVGKTRWMRKLLPTQFQSEYLYEGNIDTRNKDHVRYLSQYWFIHLDELETLRNNDISALKSFITRQRISLRKAFGRYDSHFVRRASFLGSVNDDKFLSDITGNRRWLVFKVSEINYMHEINPDDVWAQAYHLHKKGFRHWFDIEEIREINEQNERFRSVSLEEELLLRYFSFNEKKGAGEMLSSSEVIQKVVANIPSFASKMRSPQMGKALAKWSLAKEMEGGIQRYYVDYNGPVIEQTETPSKQANPSGHVYDGDDEQDDLPF